MRTDGTNAVEVRLPPHPGAPAEARTAMRHLREALGRRFDDALLIVTELVTNGIVHGPGTGSIVVSTAVEGDMVRIEVIDEGDSFEPSTASPTMGRGLAIVAGLAAQWGVDPESPCKVWAHLILD